MQLAFKTYAEMIVRLALLWSKFKKALPYKERWHKLVHTRAADPTDVSALQLLLHFAHSESHSDQHKVRFFLTQIASLYGRVCLCLRVWAITLLTSE
jgi:ribosome biogenesis protein Nip4